MSKYVLIIIAHFLTLKLTASSSSELDSLKKIRFSQPELCISKCRNEINKNVIPEKYILLSFIADCHWHLGNTDSALFYYNKSMINAKNNKAPKYVGLALSNIGYVNFEKALYNDALSNFFKATDIYKSINDSVDIYITQTYIGQLYYYIEKYNEALKIFFPLSKHYETKKEFKNASISYEMIAHIYREQKKNQEAEKYYLIALKYAELSNEKKRQAEVKINYADYLMDLRKHDKGEIIMLQAIEDLKSISSYNNIIKAYIQLGDYYQNLNQLEKAKSYFFKAEESAIKSGKTYSVLEIYESLSRLFEEENNFKEALNYHKKFKTYTDSISKESTNKEILNVTEKYESDKKEQQNQFLQTKNELSEKTIKQQQIISYFIIGGLLLVSLLAYFIFRGLKQQRKTNQIISLQKSEVEKQKHIIEEHQKEILDSIHYAKRIQYTLLAHEDFVNENIPNNFILFKPKDIVSGDFYWATKHGDKFYLAVCDSTGHGVPGAFMSLLNIGFLSEAINEKNILEPHKVLNFVRDRLINSISKEGQKDGFDGILICINKNNSQISYSAANNAPILISNHEIIELEKDRMPVGKGERTEEFKLHTLNLKPNDILYLYTDGYADQFGGPKGKKFKYKALNELLLSISSDEISIQKEKLNSTIESWKGNLEQVDDICVVGIML